MNKKVIIYGAGIWGKWCLERMESEKEVIGFCDGDPIKWGKAINNIPILGNASILSDIEYDEILIASMTGLRVIEKLLIECGVEPEKIRPSKEVMVSVESRINFLKDYSKIVKDAGNYCVAEGGVFQGEFAKEINCYFPNSKCYLFDTFDGFDARDIEIDSNKGFSKCSVGQMRCDESAVLDKLPHPERVIIKKGYFPETTVGVENEMFVFVNLDFDLFKPIYEGIKFFYPRMISGGCILIHDYFNPIYSGVVEAINKIEEENGMRFVKMPIGDLFSIALIKP